MKNTNEVELNAPSKRAIAKATGIASLVALILLFTAVLPAEYGYDPLRTGRALGLTGISQAEEAKAVAASPAPVQKGVYTSQPRIYKVDSQDFQLPPGDGMEMKYHMEKGAGLVYAGKPTASLRLSSMVSRTRSPPRTTTRATSWMIKWARRLRTAPLLLPRRASTVGISRTTLRGTCSFT